MTGTGTAAAAAAVPSPVEVRPVGDGSASDRDELCAQAARLERTVGLLLRRLRPLRTGELTRSQASLLVTVRDHGPLSLAELAAYEAVQAPTASRAVETLVQRGLLRREAAPDDHRRQVIELDSRAATLLADRSRAAVSALAGAIAELDPDGRAAVAHALPALDGLVARLGEH